MAVDPDISRIRLQPMYSAAEYRDRPRDFDPLLCDEIMEHTMNGEMIQQICERPHMPLPGTFLKWCRQDPELEKAYIQAQRIGIDLAVQYAIIASQSVNASIAGSYSKTLMTYAEKMWPEKYGSRLQVKNADPKEPDNGGINYAADVRRKIEDMAKRIPAEPETKTDEKPGS